jgi:glutamate dehydrogenase
MRLDFLRRICGKRCTDPLDAVERWSKPQAAAIRQFRMMVSRAQAAVPTAPAMLAQIAGQARNLLGR